MDNNIEMRDDEIEIDLRELVLVLWRKMIIIICATVVCGCAAFGYTNFMVTPLYESSSMIYILSKSTSITSLTDFQLSSALTADYELLATTRTVIDEVIETLELDMTYEEVVRCLTIENPSDTHALKITVTHADNTLAMQIANELANEVSEQVANLMATDMPTTWERAIVAEEPCSPSLTKNTAIGMLLGMFLSAGIIVVLFLLDDTIKSEDDVVKYLGKNVLATLPKEGKGKGKKAKKEKKDKKPQPKKQPERSVNAKLDRTKEPVRRVEKPSEPVRRVEKPSEPVLRTDAQKTTSEVNKK